MELNGAEQTIVFYDAGFFGYGPEGDFAQWSLAHIAPIVITLVLIVITSKQRERLRSWRHEETARFIFCFIGFFTLMGLALIFILLLIIVLALIFYCKGTKNN